MATGAEIGSAPVAMASFLINGGRPPGGVFPRGGWLPSSIAGQMRGRIPRRAQAPSQPWIGGSARPVGRCRRSRAGRRGILSLLDPSLRIGTESDRPTARLLSRGDRVVAGPRRGRAPSGVAGLSDLMPGSGTNKPCPAPSLLRFGPARLSVAGPTGRSSRRASPPSRQCWHPRPGDPLTPPPYRPPCVRGGGHPISRPAALGT